MRLKLKKALQLIAIIVIGIFMVATVVSFAHNSADRAFTNGWIAPPDGYPKLSLSTKVVSPTLAHTGETELEYVITILNTGAYTAEQVTLTDTIPVSTTYNDDGKASTLPDPVFSDGSLTWQGEVGFDKSVVITFSVTVDPDYTGGVVANTAAITDPEMAEPVSVVAETRVTDSPAFEISKSASPGMPGAGKPLTYELTVTNMGQEAVDTPITVVDYVPGDTTSPVAGQDGEISPDGDVITWTRSVNLDFGETTTFTFSVDVGDVPSGTVIHNGIYSVDSDFGESFGEPYTTTVVDPILILSKSVYPDPPGSGHEMIYTISAFNLGSLATGLEITDTVPASVTLVSVADGGVPVTVGDKTVITWDIGDLDTDESKQVSFTVMVPDIANVIVWNNDYGICSDEGVCAAGITTPSYISGPTFEVNASWDPVAHKPGGGSDTMVTPTITILNSGPGDAMGATALLTFGNVSIVNDDDLEAIDAAGDPVGTLSPLPLCTLWTNCRSYSWVGDLLVGDMITITTKVGQSTIGGEEWTPYTATLVITDDLSGYVTPPVTGEAIGHVTHHANLIPTKTAPAEIGPGQVMTYTIEVYNSGLSTDEFNEETLPVLTETVPASVTLLRASDGGTWNATGEPTVITWELEPMGPGDKLFRSFVVETDSDLVSGTLIVNDDYMASWYEGGVTGPLSNLGEPVTTTVREVGLIDSYKTVTPDWAVPGEGTVLTWTIHVVNSGPSSLTGVEVNDIFPWEHSTYQRDAMASSGEVISDIVSLEWTGDVAAYSEQLITFTTVVDDFFEGVLTNTATITHESLSRPVEVSAEAYITDEPVLRITKTATPDPVPGGSILTYHLEVTNIGQQATLLTITDTVAANTTYVFGSASAGGLMVDDTVEWMYPMLKHGETLKLAFQVRVISGRWVANELYAVRCDEGAYAYGEPVITPIIYRVGPVFLPFVLKN